MWNASLPLHICHPPLYLSAAVDSRYILGLSPDLLPKIIFERPDKSIYIAYIGDYIYVWSMVCILYRYSAIHATCAGQKEELAARISSS